jgi:hypothetical protein
MIRSIARLTALLVALSASAPTFAEEKAAAGAPPRIGVGVSLTTFDLASADVGFPVPTPADIYVSIDMGQLRVEPSLGISHYAIEGGDKATSFNLGVGALIQLKQTRTASVYVGPRLFLDFVSARNGAGYSDSGVDLTLAGALGGEWFADPRFSLGAEVRLGFTAAGQLSEAGNVLRAGSSRFSTSGLLFLRFYL